MGKKIMKVQVLGSGCPTCKKLFELTKQAAREMGMKTEVEYVADIQKIIKMGVMQSPVLAINGKPILAGYVPDKEKIKQIISTGIENPGADKKDPRKSCGCSCGGKC